MNPLGGALWRGARPIFAGERAGLYFQRKARLREDRRWGETEPEQPVGFRRSHNRLCASGAGGLYPC